MGILPCEFLNNQNADSLGLSGKETFDIPLSNGNIKPGQIITITTNNNITFQVKAWIDTDIESEYFKNGGILQYVMRKLIKSN